MNNNIIEQLASTLKISTKQIGEVLSLLSEGATIPFIARYRKERTGNLNEDQIRAIEEQYKYQENLLKRKEDVIRLIDEKGLLTEEIKNSVLACTKLTEIEDVYRPYKEKKKTKATEAIKAGLEPLAKKIMAFPTKGSMETLASGYNMDVDKAVEGASYIIAEWISDNANTRKYIRNYVYNNGLITSKLKPKAVDENKLYEMYYNFSERIKYAKHFHILAMNRGEDQKILSVGLEYDLDYIQANQENKWIKNKESYVVDVVKASIKDSLKRLIMPSIEREIRSELTDNASRKAIETFQANLENLLLTRPVKNSRVLGFDPAFRTGCKLAVLDYSGALLEIAVIYPHEPHNDKAGSAKKMLELIDKYNIDLIAIGNGTASRESEKFVSEVIKGTKVKYVIVSEAGASVYSASSLAKEEFPDLTVEKRSAVSIGRRIQDPLSELVKIDPKSIGIGEYQHDVNQKELNESLDFTVSKVVNEVGVNVNTASKSILKYISGLTKSVIEKIYKAKEERAFTSREDLKKVKGISDKVYEQAVGFLRVKGANPLDNTGIHPESYELTNKLLKELNLDIKDINSVAFKDVLSKANVKELSMKLESDTFTIEDIIKELSTPGLDPRDSLEAPILKSDILELKDLKVGMELQGTVRNVTSFGAFVDIGLHDDGLVHISKMAKTFVKDPKEVVNVGDIVTVYVCDVDKDKQKVALSLIPLS
ncbi:MAG TPA: RNA-binding transcriptional accessory protein [Firmicutes bacterium]|nr:RNA-binding transcriptional accessory protein [Bacillota bacterium]